MHAVVAARVLFFDRFRTMKASGASLFMQQARQILLHAMPILLAQLASMGTMLIDTVLLGHYGTEELAAVAVGGGIYIAVILALAGVVQAIAPTVAQLKGGGREGEIAAALPQGLWLALFLTLPGVLCLLYPDPLLALSRIAPEIESKVRQYLGLLAWGVPAALLYRTFYAFCNGLGITRPLMLISFICTLAHGLLAWLLVDGLDGGRGLGAAGCGVSNAVVNWLALGAGLAYMKSSAALRVYRLGRRWPAPQLGAQKALLRLGGPMGLSSFVEISAFTLVALFVAQLGTTVVAGHRIIANLAAISYMLPLSLAMATLAQVGRAAGGRDWQRARLGALAGITLACLLSSLLGFALWRFETPLIEAYTADPAVRAVCLSLIVYLAVYQVFDALQTVAAHALRAYKISFVPMLIHLLSFWGIGLFGGRWLAFHAAQPMGVAGFWLASLVSLVCAAALLGGLAWQVMRTVESSS